MSELSDNLVHVLKEIIKDWKRLSNYLKFCYLTGSFILLASWAVKIDNKPNVQFIGLCLFLSFIGALPILNWIWLHIFKMNWYRWRYKVSKLGNGFVFGRLDGTDAIHIIDFRWKRIRWVENPTTGYDLGYFPTAWTKATIIFKNFQETVEVGSKKIDLSEYRIKRGIHTRGKPGIKLDFS